MEAALLLPRLSSPQIASDGAQLCAAGFDRTACDALDRACFSLSRDRPGARLRPMPSLAPLLAPAEAIAASFLGSRSRPVRAMLFDKSLGRNWALGWHQDRVIAVRERIPVPGFEHWTMKAGIPHVEPPFALLESMLTLRIHLDDVTDSNAPLLVAPGSHRLGAVAELDLKTAVSRLGVLKCRAAAGDVWIYAAPILHASERAIEPGHRRVIQLSYSADDLPGGLEWLGV